LGWYKDEELTKEYTFSKMPNKNITLNAKWNINTYNITFHTNGGSEIPSTKIEYND